jgi:dienelactone hydrolase
VADAAVRRPPRAPGAAPKGKTFAALILSATAAAHAAVVEEVVQLPVSIKDAAGGERRYDMTLTVFRDDARDKSPFLILNHGRAGTAAARARLGRARYRANSGYFVDRGFAVFVPTRLGYGVSGGPDLEDSGPCERRDFAPGFEAAADQSAAVIDYAKAQAFVDPNRGLLVGQSYGGATTLAIMARNIEGILGGINFAGGSGGRPERRPGDPCSPAELGRVLAGYGASIRRPTLWLYAQNDLYWGPSQPRRWFEGFRAAGGAGAFVRLPAYGSDGHASFVAHPSAWRPHVEGFMSSLGLSAARRAGGQ